MINMSDTFKSKIYSSERYLEANVLINNVDYETDIIKDFKYHSSIASNSFAIGSTNASTFEITLNKLVETIEENHEVKPYIGIIGAEKIPLGVFYIQEIKRDRNAKITKIKCQDKMMYLNELYTTDLAFPAKIRDVIQDISKKVKMDFVPTHISYNKEVTKLEKVSYREMLSYLAQIEGCFVVFDRYGKLEFRKFNRTQEKITKNNYFLNCLVVNDVEYKLNGIIADLKNKEKTILASGSAVGNQINLVNPLMKQGYLDDVYNYLKQFIFKPYTINWQGNPALEVGDFVQIEVANGEYIGVPVLDLQLNFSGGLNCKMSADVKTSTSTSYEYKGTIQKQIEFLNARVGADGTNIFADTTEPKNPNEGDTWFKPNGAYTDLYIFEKGQWVLKVSTGNIQELVTKITTDEVLAPKLTAGIAKIIELDASKITSGYLHTDRLQSGSITERLISDETKQGLVKGLVTETKYNELIADNTKFKSEIGTTITNEVSKIQIGGRNIARNSQIFDKNSWENWAYDKLSFEHSDNDRYRDVYVVKFNTFNTSKNSDLAGYYEFNVNFNKKKIYSISFDILNLSDSDIEVGILGFNEKDRKLLKSKEDKRLSFVVSKNDTDYEQLGIFAKNINKDIKFAIQFLKVEEGTISTTWTPAIEDFEEEQKNNKNKILNIISDNEDLKKKIQDLQTENLNLKKNVSTELKQTKESFEFVFSSFKDLYDENNKLIQNRLDDFKKYIRFISGKIEIGELNSPFKSVQEKDKIKFLYNDLEVAYFSNQKLYVTDGEFLNSLILGNFGFFPRENGNLSFKKIGGK